MRAGHDPTGLVWPAFTDLMSGILLAVLVAFSLIVDRADPRALLDEYKALRQTVSGLSVGLRRCRQDLGDPDHDAGCGPPGPSFSRCAALLAAPVPARADLAKARLIAENPRLRQCAAELATALACCTQRARRSRELLGVARRLVERLQERLVREGVSGVALQAHGSLEFPADLFFGSNQDRIPEGKRASVEAIGRAIYALLEDPELRRAIDLVVVIGHTDSQGGWDTNTGLSTRRAASLVKLWRRQLHPTPCIEAKILAGGVGEGQPVVADEGAGQDWRACENQDPEEPGCRKNRRIEVRIIPRPADAPEGLRCQQEELR